MTSGASVWPTKTFAAAELTLYWLARFPDGKVVTTAPGFTQVKEILWPKIRDMVAGSLLAYPTPLETVLRLGPENFAIGISTDRAIRFHGWSGRVLVVIDEGPGVGTQIFEAIKGIRAGGRVTIFMLGNPTILGGPYQDAFTKDRARWHTITLNAFESPKVRPLLGDLDPLTTPDELLVKAIRDAPESSWPTVPTDFQDLVGPEWILEVWEDDGPDSIDWEARVMGRFPRHGENELISADTLEAWAGATDPEGPIDVGIDPAGPGENETAYVSRCLDTVLEVKSWRERDCRGRVVAELRKVQDRLRRVCVDVAGIGEGMYLHLRDEGFPVEEINVGKTPWGATDTDVRLAKERFANLKAQLYWALKERADVGDLRGVEDPETVAQLSTVRWSLTPRGQIAIEKKEQRQRRGLSSPDRAEALMLAFAEPPKRGIPKLEPTHY